MTNPRTNALVGLAAASALALTGCGGHADAESPPPATAPTPLASVTPTTTPASTPTPSSTPSADLQAQAEAVYRDQFDAFVVQIKRGGLAMSEPTPASLAEYLDGAALTKRLNELHQMKQQQITYVSGEPRIVWVKPSSKREAGAVVALESCEDATDMVTSSQGVKAPGQAVNVDTYYALVKGKLKVIDNINKVVKTCVA